jgi:hypothetical protein
MRTNGVNLANLGGSITEPDKNDQSEYQAHYKEKSYVLDSTENVANMVVVPCRRNNKTSQGIIYNTAYLETLVVKKLR